MMMQEEGEALLSSWNQLVRRRCRWGGKSKEWDLLELQ